MTSVTLARGAGRSRRASCAGLMALVLIPLLCGGCLGTLRRDPVAEQIILTAADALDLPVRASQPYWLLRAESGWLSAHEIRYGGESWDPAVATVRLARFRTVDDARHGFSRLGSAYLQLAYRDRMTWPPRPFDYPTLLPGDEVTVLEYGVRLPPGPQNVELAGQYTVIRAGTIVLLIESIGVTPDHLVPAVASLTRAARERGSGAARRGG